MWSIIERKGHLALNFNPWRKVSRKREENLVVYSNYLDYVVLETQNVKLGFNYFSFKLRSKYIYNNNALQPFKLIFSKKHNYWHLCVSYRDNSTKQETKQRKCFICFILGILCLCSYITFLWIKLLLTGWFLHFINSGHYWCQHKC